MSRVGVDLERAWAAGFFDGEGNVNYGTPARRRPRLVVQVAQVNREPLDRFCAVVGIGKVRGPYKPKTTNSHPYHVWSIEGYEQVRGIWMILGPWLSGEKQDAFDRGVSRYQDWLADPRCWRNHPTMQHDKGGKFYCPTCKSQAGRLGGTR